MACGTSCNVERRVATGEPVNQILSAARAIGADLIVIGSHGLTRVARLAFGSTMTGVMRRSPIPVLVVRANDGAMHQRPRPWPRGRIIAPLMLDHRTADDIAAISRIAAWFGCSLLLVHVLGAPVAPAWLRRRLPSRTGDGLERSRRQLASAPFANARVSTRTRVVEGAPAEIIAATANSQRTPLIVMMLRDRRRWFEPGRGALTCRVGARVNVPVLACPPRWRPR
jgi:universal stress protein E